MHERSKLGNILMIDRTTKLALIAIAAGLWANALLPVFFPQPARAQDDNSDALQSMASDISDISTAVSDIKDDVSDIANGSCPNDAICK